MRSDNPQSDIRRTTNATLDTDFYYRRARTERADFLRAVLSCVARCGGRAWGCIKARMEGQTARRELSALSTRELKDLGLARGDLDALANGTYFTDSTRCSQSRGRLRKYT